MKKEDAIKYLQQLYPNGGNCWLDEQRIEAIGIAIKALQEEPVSDTQPLAMFYGMTGSVGNTKEEPVSEDLKEAAKEYSFIDGADDTEKYARYDIKKYNSFKAGAQWQKEQMMSEAIDARCFGFQDAALFSFRLPASNYLVGSEVKVIVIKGE